MTPDPVDVAAVAAGLTKSQRGMIMESGDCTLQNFLVPDANPLFKPVFDQQTRNFGWTRTALGLAVRSYLMGINHDG